MKTRITTILFLITMFTILNAQQLQTGIVQYPEYGIQFTIPNGWFGKEMNEGYAMQSKTETGLVMLLVNELTSISALKEEFSKNITEEGIVLRPENNIQVKTNYVKGYYTGTADGETVKVLAYGCLNPYGNGVTAMIMARTNDFSKVHETTLLKIKNSLKLTKPKVNESFNAAICTRELGGKRLKHEKNTFSPGGVGGVSGSYSITRIIDLCPSGRFTYYGGSNVSVESENAHGYSGGTNDNQGKWEFRDEAGKVLLYLHYNNGESRYYHFTYGEDGGTYLDNTRYYRLNTNCNY
ncbi:hypothetical protein [Aquimarina litoralis]|uniref:hypothetical protein n=1 Tax=Aquimarina litoralis TaxID=584605 RepID=UPI001C56D5CF|nr:hypothetical protein [Aquimarina litoralis]MBW1295908.1 hypothetical protein [Aquimarina litoralis]